MLLKCKEGGDARDAQSKTPFQSEASSVTNRRPKSGHEFALCRNALRYSPSLVVGFSSGR